MKKIIFIALIIVVASCGLEENKKMQELAEKASSEVMRKDFEKVREYNDSIVAEQEKIRTKMLGFQNVLESQDSLLIFAKLEVLKKQIAESIETVKKMGPYQKDNRLQLAALKLFKYYENVVENEIREMAEIRLKGLDNLTDAERDRLRKIALEVGEREMELDNNLIKVQKAFTSDHGAKAEEKSNKIDSSKEKPTKE